MSRRSAVPSREPAPWWAGGGTETCPCCLQSYAYEVEVRCTDCDRPTCPHCTVVVRGVEVRRLCPQCAPADGSG